MKNIKLIKQELINFGKKHKACKEGLESIEGTTLTELFNNIYTYIYWCKENKEKTIAFNNIFNNELVIEDGILICNCTNLESIIIPNSVTSISRFAFNGCKELTSITIPNSVTYIGNFAFRNCIGLNSIIIPDLVTSIGDGVFSDCTGLTSITIPNSVTSIGKYAFCNCKGLKSITIPNSVTSIDRCGFWYCNPELKIIRK